MSEAFNLGWQIAVLITKALIVIAVAMLPIAVVALIASIGSDINERR